MEATQRFTVKSFFKGIKSPGETGFTLLEMIFSISITGLLLAVLAQFLITGTRIWESGDRSLSLQHRMSSVYQVLYNDLAVMYNGRYLPEPVITGDEYSLSFWRESIQGLVMVKYRYDHEGKVYRSEGFWGSSPPERLLFQDVVSWEFEYYQDETKNPLRKWEKEYKGMPSVIRLKAKVKDGDLGTMQFPIKARPYEGKDGE